jgi:hypothetical protein
MASKPKPQYTRQQLEKMMLTPCKTEQELKNFIKYFFELQLPDVQVSRYADTDPFHMVYEVYDICINKNNPQNIQELMYVASRGAGKCVSKDTLIKTSNGFKYIQNIKPGDVVWTGWSWKPVVEWFDEGIKEGVTITTKIGTKEGSNILSGSLKHRIQALDPITKKINWQYMRDLKPGDWVYKSSERQQVNTNSKDYVDGWIVGSITGDGCLNRSSSDHISLCSSDFKMLRYFAEQIYSRFGIAGRVKRNSKRSVSIHFYSVAFKKWFGGYVSGDLSYFKKLKTLEHSYDFLAGFISGLMDTNGSKGSIILANRDLIQQIGHIMQVFGVNCAINNSRRKPSTTKYVPGHIVTYHEAKYDSLPDCLLPLFSKRIAFIKRRDKINEQHRYPSILVQAFGLYIREKYEIANGYWRLEKGKKTHSRIKYANELLPTNSEGHIYGYKIDSFIALANKLCEYDWAEYLTFVRNGFYERVETVVFENNYFYDLEVDGDHSYWSNGFISHNTLGSAIAELLVILHDQRDVVHLGAILSQAKRCYAYQQKFILNSKMKSVMIPSDIPEDQRILEKTNMEKSIFNIKGEKVTLEVLPVTLKAVNGPHVPLIFVDEIDTVSGEGLRAYNDIAGMLDSKGNKKALRVGISTRKSRYGLMNKAIENANKEGRTVRSWTILEFSERCPDERSGINPTLGYYNTEKLETITEEEFKRKDITAQNSYLPHIFAGEGCLKCPMAALCLSDSKKQTSKSPMLKPIGDAIKKVIENGPDWAISQLFNLKPSVEGIIYKEFDEKLHVKTWNQMWKILTGIDYPGECTHDMFVRKCFSSDTEVLTNNGFKLFKDLAPNDTIASLNDSGQLIYEKPLDYINYHYKGKMINIFNEIGGGGRKLDLLITPDHEQEYLTSHIRSTNVIKIQKAVTSKLPVEFYIPAAPLIANSNDDSNCPDYWFELWGLWLSEGSINSNKCLTIGQYKSEENCKKVEDLFARSGLQYKFLRDCRFQHGGIWSFYDDEFSNLVIEESGLLCHNKRIPKSILRSASDRQLRLMFDWMMFGDGSHAERKTPYYATSSKAMADDFQELAFRIGYKTSLSLDSNPINRGHRPIYRISVTLSDKLTQKSWHIHKGQMKRNLSENKDSVNHVIEVDYDGMVYCVTMPSTRLFVRRNGVITLSGNCRQLKLSCFAGVDWGWSNPSTLVIFYVDSKENVYVVRCDGRTYYNNPNWIHLIKTQWHSTYGVQLYFPDMANPGDAQLMRQEGLPCPSKVDKNVPDGVQIIKKWLRSLSSPNPKLFFAKETCGPIIDEFSLYHFETDAAGNVTETPTKEYDHWLDALRYPMFGLFGKASLVTSSHGLDLASDSPIDRNGNYSHAPSAAEFAKQQGVNFNDSLENVSKVGQIGTLSELALQDEDDDASGSGAFLWSF